MISYSILIVTYNQKEILGKILNGLTRQIKNPKLFEIVVADGLVGVLIHRIPLWNGEYREHIRGVVDRGVEVALTGCIASRISRCNLRATQEAPSGIGPGVDARQARACVEPVPAVSFGATPSDVNTGVVTVCTPVDCVAAGHLLASVETDSRCPVREARGYFRA